ncbi:MAG: hypothetical protein KC656_36135, partial [Myxococcales bacterium]|nr:hypothetical protein [Myxococcales bacterium]
MRAWAPLWLVACSVAEPGPPVLDPDLVPPTITTAEVSCDPEDGVWSVTVETDAWAGGAVLLWTTDGAFVERHTGFRSLRAAPDGTADRLRA